MGWANYPLGLREGTQNNSRLAIMENHRHNEPKSQKQKVIEYLLGPLVYSYVSHCPYILTHIFRDTFTSSEITQSS